MKKQILSIATFFYAIFALAMSSCSDHGMDMDMNMNAVYVPIIEGSFTTELTLPPLVGENVTLTAQSVTTNLIGIGTINGLGYATGGLLGPTIKIDNNSTININFVNQLSENSNIHWHGLKVPANMDGHPENVISGGGSFNYNFKINQRAGMYWYHPHPDMLTGKQVFKGLAGLFIVNDNEETSLNLPSGNREIPIVIQDKRISSGNITYSPNMMEQMSGYMGQFVLVNSIYAPVQYVETAKYRIRILNGSNARIYNLALSNGASFTLIGNDGGLLASPEVVNSLLVGPGERADLILDFSATKLNTELFLISKTFNGGDAQGKEEFKIMKFKTTSQVIDNFIIPSSLSTINILNENSATQSRNFDIQNVATHMTGNMMTHTINDKVFDMNRIDESVKLGATEIWTFDNTNGKEPHPMHLHGVQFQILSRTGGRGTLSPLERGWKDMALCMPGEKVKIIIPFTIESGKYVFHCHNLEHEDTGMMGQFQIK